MRLKVYSDAKIDNVTYIHFSIINSLSSSVVLPFKLVHTFFLGQIAYIENTSAIDIIYETAAEPVGKFLNHSQEFFGKFQPHLYWYNLFIKDFLTL